MAYTLEAVNVTPSSRIILDEHARFRRFEEEGIIVNQQSAEAVVVNDSGARLLELSDGHRTVHECATAIGEEFDADPDLVERDLLRFAGELLEAGVAKLVQP